MGQCKFCHLPLPDGTGPYCCPGCEQVAATVDDVAELEVEDETTTDSVPSDAKEAYFSVGGMHCTTCEAFLSARAADIDGVYTVEPHYGIGAARVRYDPETIGESTVAEALSGAGYTFYERSQDAPNADRDVDSVQRLVVGGFLAMLIMPWYFFWLYPQYVGFEGGLLELGRTTTVGIYFPLVLIALLTTIILGYTGYPVLRGAWISLKTRQPNMDLLVSVAALAAYAYSVIALAGGSTHLYFDVSVMVILVVSLGRHVEGSLRADATSQLAEITQARVDTVTRLTDSDRERVSIDAVSPGDRLLVQPGERVPVDGTVSAGTAAVDTALLTGESLPETLEPGDHVVGGAIVLEEPLVVTVGPEATSTIDRIVRGMWDIQADHGGVQRFADRLATIFVPLVLAIAALVTIVQLGTGISPRAALLLGLTILIVSCPCAMGLATPLALTAGIRDALHRGIVITNESVFELAPDADVVVFDKTGTLTAGELTVADVTGPDETLSLAAAVERHATHPIADAILDATETVRTDGGVLSRSEPSAFTRHPGEGVSAQVDGRTVVVGTPELVRSKCGPIESSVERTVGRIRDRDRLPIVVGWDGVGRGVLELVDRGRDTWMSVLDEFRDATVAICSGDTPDRTRYYGDHPAVDHVFAGVPPDGKAETVRRFREQGTTVMVGDGTNDGPALAQADVGIALGDGTATAVDGADVVVLESTLADLPHVFDLARGTNRRIKENIGWALLYNAIALPLAIVGLINPFFAAVAMTASSVIVVANSRRRVV